MSVASFLMVPYTDRSLRRRGCYFSRFPSEVWKAWSPAYERLAFYRILLCLPDPDPHEGVAKSPPRAARSNFGVQYLPAHWRGGQIRISPRRTSRRKLVHGTCSCVPACVSTWFHSATVDTTITSSVSPRHTLDKMDVALSLNGTCTAAQRTRFH